MDKFGYEVWPGISYILLLLLVSHIHEREKERNEAGFLLAWGSFEVVQGVAELGGMPGVINACDT